MIEVPTLKDSDPEVRKESRTCTAAAEQDSIESLIQHYSSWWKLKKAFSWILLYKKFLQYNVCKPNIDGALDIASNPTSAEEIVGNLPITELQRAEEEIVRQVQKANFQKVFEALSKLSPGADERLAKKTIQKVGTLIFKLNPKLRNGLLSVGGRLQSAPVDEDLKYPYILPNDHRVTELIIQHSHRSVGNMCQESVLSTLRERFWIIKGRSAVRRVLKRCVDFQKTKAPTGEQFMANVPEDRISPTKLPSHMSVWTVLAL